MVVSRVKKGGTSTYWGKGEVIVDSPEQLITVGIWEYQWIQGTEKWWLLRLSNLLWRRWGSWFDCSLVITTTAQRPGWIFPCSCVVHSILLHGRWRRLKDVQHVGETKLNCFWHCYQSFRICLYVRIILMKLYRDAMKVSTLFPAGKKGFNFGSRRKKRFQLRIHVSFLEIISLQHSIKYKWNYHG